MENSEFVAGINYSDVEGIQRKRILKFVNHFVTQTTNFLSNFSQSCDVKLFHLAEKLKKVEISLVLLETKLNSIPQLQQEIKEEATKVEEIQEIREENPEVLIFKRMLEVGVPIQAVKLKMQNQGLDPKLLDS